MENPVFTVGDLRRHLELFPDDCELIFGPYFSEEKHLTFYRTKQRGESLVQIEFNELIEIIDRPE